MRGRCHYCSKCSDAPRPEASALTRIALPGTPAAFRASTIDWARDRPRFSAADWASGSLDGGVAIAGDGDRAVAALGGKGLHLVGGRLATGWTHPPGTRSWPIDRPKAPAWALARPAGRRGRRPRRAASAARPATPASGPGSAAAAAGGGHGGAAAAAGAAARRGGASSGALCTALRGAADGGGGVAVGRRSHRRHRRAGHRCPGERGPACRGLAAGGGGGGAVPTPNSDGEAVGEDGSASGADCAACCALVRSATSESVSFFNASASGVSGLAGTVAMFGIGLIGPGRRRALFGDLSAFLPMPPVHRVHRRNVEEQPARQQQLSRHAAWQSPAARRLRWVFSRA